VGPGVFFNSLQNPQSREPSYGCIEMRDYMAKVTLVPGAEVFDDKANLRARMPDPRWNPRKTALVMKSVADKIPDLAAIRKPSPAPLPPMPPSTSMSEEENAARPAAGASGQTSPRTAEEASSPSVPPMEAIEPRPALPVTAPSNPAPSATNMPVLTPAPLPAQTNQPDSPMPTPAVNETATNIPAHGSGGSTAETNLPPPLPAGNKASVPEITTNPALQSPPVSAGSGVPLAPLGGSDPRLGTSTGAGAVRIQEFDKHVTAFNAITQVPVIAVINDHFEDEWTATVNGRPVPLLRVNEIMMGVALPAGSSDVVLRYAPSQLPAYIGLLTWIALLLIGASRLMASRAGNPLNSQYFKNTALYKEFLEERDEILKHQAVLSEKAGHDVGWEKALQNWIVMHRSKWRTSRKGKRR
jgi:hypothetical protein